MEGGGGRVDGEGLKGALEKVLGCVVEVGEGRGWEGRGLVELLIF